VLVAQKNENSFFRCVVLCIMVAATLYLVETGTLFCRQNTKTPDNKEVIEFGRCSARRFFVLGFCV
jgi:hypothetical protein